MSRRIHEVKADRWLDPTMPKRAVLIKDLVIEEVMVEDLRQGIPSYNVRAVVPELKALVGGEDDVIEHRVLPVHQFHRIGPKRDDYKSTFIVYTPEVQEFLGMPFDLYKEEHGRLADQLARAESQLAQWKHTAETEHQRANNLARDIAQFFKRPWYQRIWYALQYRMLI